MNVIRHSTFLFTEKGQRSDPSAWQWNYPS